MKKILSLALSIIMIITIIPSASVFSFAENVITGSCGDNAVYSLDKDSGILTISGTGETDYFMLRNVINNNQEIKSVIINNGITYIGEDTFYNCKNLIDITFPSSITEIRAGSFIGCTSLLNITVDENNKTYSSVNGILYNKQLTTLICYPAGKPETEYTVAGKVSEIDWYAFKSVVYLKTVTLGTTLRGVREGAFDKNIQDLYVLSNKCGLDTKSVDKNTTIHSYKTSLAYDFAKKYKYNFVEMVCPHKSLNRVKTNAVLGHNGYIEDVCLDCGKRIIVSTIYAIKTIKLSTSAYYYDGKVKTPSVSVYGSDGKKISSSNYTVSYASGRKYVGKYAVKVTFKGSYYSGSKMLYFTIVPRNTKITSISKPAKGQLKVNFSKQTGQTTGYQIQLCKSKTFKSGVKTVTMWKNSYKSYTVKGLSRNTGYYIRIRTFKTVGKANYFSPWSSCKGAKTK